MPYCNAQFYRCYDGGAGEFCYPTILLHGLGGNHLSWPANLRHLPGQKIYALDLPGHGSSQLPACSSIDCHVRCLHQFISDMGFYNVNLVGHSMGAAIAYAYAKKHPNRVQKLSLIAFGNQFHYLQQLEQLVSHPSTREKAIALITSKGFYPAFPKQTRMMVMEPLREIRASVLFSDVRSCLDSNLVNFPANQNFPIQLIAAENDQFVPIFEARCFANGIKEATLEVISNCGHMVVFEKPDIVRKLIKDFLEKPLSIWS